MSKLEIGYSRATVIGIWIKQGMRIDEERERHAGDERQKYRMRPTQQEQQRKHKDLDIVWTPKRETTRREGEIGKLQVKRGM